MSTSVDPVQNAVELLGQYGQSHVLRFVDDLDETARAGLLEQIAGQDWATIGALIESHVKAEPRFDLPEHIEPAPCMPYDPAEDQIDLYADARAHGERLLEQGKVAAFVVAGGQGTRLGWHAPKGTYPATPVTGKPLFQVFAEYLIKIGKKFGAPVPWYIMTSPANDADTRAFFVKHGHFGLDPSHVMFFEQGTMPSIDLDGRVLLESPDRLAVNPDGHGGSLRALHVSGALDDMQRRGIDQISYFQVDNPVVKCIDPLFIGLHARDEAQMSSKIVLKTDPVERVGVITQVKGQIQVIEYSDLSDELAQQRNGDGSLRFSAGSIAIHVIETDFVRRLNTGRFALPYHRAVKKVPYVDPSTGQHIEPDEPNAVKLESFVFDALPLCEHSIVYQTDRTEEFAPIKNVSGPDSAQTSRDLQIERAGRWLESVGVSVARDEGGRVDAVIEISPLTAIGPEDLREVELPRSIEAGAKVSL